MLGFTLSEEQLAIQKLAKEFTEKEIKPVAAKFEKDEDGKLAEAIFKKAAEVGILGLPIPNEYGGSDASNVECSIVLEELAVGCGAISTSIGASWFGQTPIMMAATTEQRQRWLPPLTRDGNLCCMAMTEPAGGSAIENPHMHSKTIRTIVRADGDDYVINGTKIWPSNSTNSYLYTVVATVNPELGDEGSCLIVIPALVLLDFLLVNRLRKWGWMLTSTQRYSSIMSQCPGRTCWGRSEMAPSYCNAP